MGAMKHYQIGLETVLHLLSVLDPLVDDGDVEGTRQIALTAAKAADRVRLRDSADLLRRVAHHEVEEWADARGMVEREALHALLTALRPDVAEIDVSRARTNSEGYVVPCRAEFTEEDGVDFVGWASGSMWVTIREHSVVDVWVGDWTPEEVAR